jgi:hypothetical protein
MNTQFTVPVTSVTVSRGQYEERTGTLTVKERSLNFKVLTRLDFRYPGSTG